MEHILVKEDGETVRITMNRPGSDTFTRPSRIAPASSGSRSLSIASEAITVAAFPSWYAPRKAG